MKNAILTLGSVTYAIKSRKLLIKNGIKTKVIKVDNSHRGDGCTYGIEFPRESFYTVIILLRQENISYNVYKD